MLKVAMVGLGGATGAVLRYMVYELCIAAARVTWLPLGTIIVNIAGCFIIGFLGGLGEIKNIFTPEARAFLFVGFLGGFTTFSTFGFELFNFLRNGQPGMAVLNAVLQLTFGLIGVWLGFSLSKLC